MKLQRGKLVGALSVLGKSQSACLLAGHPCSEAARNRAPHYHEWIAHPEPVGRAVEPI